MEQPNNPYPEIPNSSNPYEPPNASQKNEQESLPYAYTQPNQPNYQVPPPQEYGQFGTQGAYAMGQPTYMPGGVGNTFGQPFILSN